MDSGKAGPIGATLPTGSADTSSQIANPRRVRMVIAYFLLVISEKMAPLFQMLR
jgi:hypothetical protein